MGPDVIIGPNDDIFSLYSNGTDEKGVITAQNHRFLGCFPGVFKDCAAIEMSATI